MGVARYNAHTMSQNQFSNLMSQYGSEAEQQKCGEARAETRSQMFQRIRRGIMLLIFAGAMAAAVVYRNEVTTSVSLLTSKFRAPTPYAQAEANTKNKVADIKNEALNRQKAIDETFK